ncbi:isochorismate synthase [Psychromonas sp. MME2]|uniref:isochorismate synthase n=1 Tax=unclassified Psychromonas TaxID=2614957 RepID=UPI00339C0703
MISFIKQQLHLFAKQHGETPCDNLVISLPLFDLLAFLKGQTLAPSPIYPSIYWQDRNQQQTIVCLGQIEEHYCVPNVTDPQACYFGGLAFQQQGEQWPDFPAVRFIRPALEFKQYADKVTLTCHFNGQNGIHSTDALVTQLQTIAPLSKNHSTILSRTERPNQQQWADLVELAIEYKALLPKVVLSRQTEIICAKKINHVDLLAEWQKANKASFHFSFQFSQKHAFIGCSPERLFCRNGNQLNTEALAGTINRGRNEKEDQFLLQSLLTDKKIDRENYLVQEFIIANLKQLKATVCCDDARVMQLQNVQHLCVPIKATLAANTNDASLLHKLHPTPAVGGSPKHPALQFINDNEPYIRGWYAGAVGYLSAQKSDFSVAIRSALVKDNKIKLFAGAGIVTGSIAQQEWQELDNKIHTILTILSSQQ